MTRHPIPAAGHRLATLALVLSLAVGCTSPPPSQKATTEQGRPDPIVLVVMDPLAKELACACVKGYGQRDYRKLAARLEKSLNQRIAIEFSDDLAESLVGLPAGGEVIVIGDQSLVAHGAKRSGVNCHRLCELTDREGSTTLTASFVARSDDPGKELKDLAGRTLLFGLAEVDQKYSASLAALRAAGVPPPATPEHRTSSDAALDVLDSPLSPPPVAVIPSYSIRLLEGCGTVRPGNLKVIARTQPVPFITVFVADAIPAAKEQKILQTLLSIKSDANLLKSMESRDGFTPVKAIESSVPPASASVSWPDWRGPRRDGHVPRLPPRLPATPKVIWKKATMIGSLAGLSVSGE